MTRAYLGCAAVLCMACGGNVDLGGATKSGGGTSGTGSAGSGASASGGKGGSSTGGEAGVGGATGGASGGGGSGGTPVVDCSKFQRTGDPVQVSSDNEAAFPTLVRTGSGATVLYRVSSPGPGFQIHYPSWADPWTGAWAAPNQASPAIEDPSPNYGYVFQASAGVAEGSVVALHSSASNGCLGLTSAFPSYSNLAAFPCPPPFFTYGPDPAAIIAGEPAPTGGETYVIAHQTGYGAVVPSNYQINFARVDLPTGVPPGTITSSYDSLGCATAPLYARGWYSPSAGYLVAFTTSRPFLHCQLDQYADGPPTRLQIVSLGPAGDLVKGMQLVHEVVLPNEIMSLELARRADGGVWLAFQTASSGTGTSAKPGAIHTLALDATGKPTTDVTQLVPGAVGLDANQAVPLGVAALGNRLVVAGTWASQCGESYCPPLQLFLIDENKPGSLVSVYHATTPSAVMLGSPITLVGSSDGARLIAAYSDWTGNPTDVWAERFECVP